jgi:serine/threonine protein kinase
MEIAARCESVLSSKLNSEDFYEIKEKVGSGAFGKVYRAVDPITGTEVAVKVM